MSIPEVAVFELISALSELNQYVMDLNSSNLIWE
ncbi:hypothetical protein SLEP1_g24543 [Rubroshorea leprosula]|uniref:Uncharacterized protein n=1 Tax=Rubroshorea leprosula TaxID=152421 RepID=A0AAV5JPS6_9ROSI|nr:hypothetical protein SLEP1_g24543 [Rubroshorea leprosula]